MITSKGGFRTGRGCVRHVFTLKRIGEKAREKKCRVYMGLIDLEMAYDRAKKKSFLASV